MFAGHDPADLLHSLLGVGISTQILSTAYAAFIVFLPLSLAVALVFSRDIRAGLFYATALSANWVLGAASYFLLPSLGPIYYEPQAFAHLPHSEVTRLQDMLLDQRVEFLVHPATATPAEHRGVRLAAHLDEPDRRAGGAPAGAGAAAEDRRCGPGSRSRPSRPSTWAGTTCSTTSAAWSSPWARSLAARALTGIDLRAARLSPARPSRRPRRSAPCARRAAPAPGARRRRCSAGTMRSPRRCPGRSRGRRPGSRPGP